MDTLVVFEEELDCGVGEATSGAGGGVIDAFETVGVAEETLEIGGVAVGSIGTYIGALCVSKNQEMVDSIVVFTLSTRSITRG